MFLSFFILKHKEIFPAVKLNNYVIGIFLVNVLPSHWFQRLRDVLSRWPLILDTWRKYWPICHLNTFLASILHESLFHYIPHVISSDWQQGHLYQQAVVHLIIQKVVATTWAYFMQSGQKDQVQYISSNSTVQDAAAYGCWNFIFQYSDLTSKCYIGAYIVVNHPRQGYDIMC